MTGEQEQLVLQILSKLHQHGYKTVYKLGEKNTYACIYCGGSGEHSRRIDHSEKCVTKLSKQLEQTLTNEE